MNQRIHFMEYIMKDQDQDREILDILRRDMKLTTKKIRALKKEEKGILLDGQRVTVRARGKAGQCLQIMLNDSLGEDHIIPRDMDLVILYEDEDLLVVSKPSGIVSHPSIGHKEDSLANGVKAYFINKDENSSVHLVGRLDKDTSGILGIAKNGVTKERMIAMRLQGQVRKEYLAIVEGMVNEQKGLISLSMEEYRDEADGFRLKMRKPILPEGGLEARTHYEVLKQYSEYALVKLSLETGRMHQIRFHMASIGHPLLGDPIYGHGFKLGMRRTALHAWKLTFYHPYDTCDIPITIMAELEEDMKTLLNPE